ncbi:MAG TPA: mandelate racemase/muconate lactonizing enzyme family protein [Acidimicrobiales bacterium]|nr:mandelate racemase/muconate lactonizing enzyme family protein [Acidimicrobiales bacterium]
MKLAAVTATAVRVPVKTVTRMSTRLLDKRDFLLVSITDADQGHVGIGYSYAGTSGGALLAHIVDDLLAPALGDRLDDGIVGAWERLYQEALLVGRRGAVLRALSAIDIALWDLLAKRAGLPLAEVLGGSSRRVPAYASGGYYRPSEGGWADAVAAEIKLNKQLGFHDHKIKVGGLPVEEDAIRVAAAIEAIGGDGRLALDANNAYRSIHEAARATKAFERAAGDAGLWWMEEPLVADDLSGHVALAARVDTPIATGEIAQTRWEFRDLADPAADIILQPDAGVLGGVTEWMRVARAAETARLSVAPHWHANLHVHLVAAVTNAMPVEHFALEKDIYNFELLLTPDSRLQFEDGELQVPDRPGLGVELEPAAVEEYAVRG